MAGQVQVLFDESIELLQRFGKCLVADSNCDIKSEFDKLSPVTIDICDARTKYMAVENIFNDFIGAVENSEEIDAEDIVRNFKTDIDKTISNLPLGVKNETYVDLKNSLFIERTQLDDSEIATVSETRTTIDPITKLPLTDPVKNIKCGHVYEKLSIFQLFKQRKVIKCPIAGCTAADGVHKDDLIPDADLKRYLDSIKKS